MTPINLNQFSPAPLEEEEQDLSHPRISILPINPFSFSCPIFINTPPEATDIHHHHQIYYYQQPPEGRTAISSSSSNSSDGLLPFSSKEEAYYNGYTSTKKVISSKSSGSNSNFNVGVVRTCSDCNTAKTPLWRSGPRGPKSLCNACGIRQRKARRAIAASATVGNAPSLVQREKNSDCNRTVPYKKRWKFTAFDCSELR